MAEFTSETVTRTIRRWIVPAAELAYRKHHGIPKEQPLHDDALRFHVRDEEIVIEFAEEAKA
ncbi:hypothetical protein PYK79_48390 [Streptomyces sp. ID05-04B]|uniref:hypothetical protein n=1 Tax=Streptomyces sp. ID05-04B TaxID=3028661 RepID=UPI0029C3F53C|nr:hypothetical protein [Streptomyces sp. ID05-04B]MDX5569523.1 hypothetical protein [Streptomyces sp. ID05-04B]